MIIRGLFGRTDRTGPRTPLPVVAGQSKVVCTARTDEPRGAVSLRPALPGAAPSTRRAPVGGPVAQCGREVGAATRARGRDQGNRMVTSRDGVPRLPPGRGRRARHAGAGHGQQPTRMSRLGTVVPRSHRGPPSPPARAGRALPLPLPLPLHCVPLALWQVGLGSRLVVRSDREIETSRTACGSRG